MDGDPPHRSKGRPKERTLVLGTLPKDPGVEDSEPPPAPGAQRAPDPMATRLEAGPGDLSEPGRLERSQPQQASTADTARTHVDESTADTARRHVQEVSSADTARTHLAEAPPVDGARQAPAQQATAATLEAPAHDVAPKLASVWDQPAPQAQPAARPAAPAPVAAQPPPPARPQPTPAAQWPPTPAQPQPRPQAAQWPPTPQEPRPPQPGVVQRPAAPPPAQQPQAQPAAPPREPSPRRPAAPSKEDAKAARKAAQKARVLMDRGNYDEALSHAHRAMGLNRTSAEYAALCGYLVHLSGAAESGLIDQCLALFERAMTLDPKHAGAHYYKALVLQASGRTREAIEHFERTLDLNPDHLEAARQLRDHGRKRETPQGGGFGRLMKGLKR